MELIVVDDCSTDGTAEYLRIVSKEPWIRVVSHQTPLQYAARNIGIAAAKGELIAITDDDCTVADDWLASLATAIESSGADAVGGAVDAPGDALWIRYLAETRFLRPELLPTGDARYVMIGNACFRRTALERVQLLDVGLWMLGDEDVELSFRMRKQGMRLVFAPQCRVSHWYTPDVRGMLRRSYRTGASWRVQLERHRHWEFWTPRADVALAWIVQRRGPLRGFFEVPDRALRSWYGLLDWLQHLCFLAGYLNVSRASHLADLLSAKLVRWDGLNRACDLPSSERLERTHTLLAILSDRAVAAQFATFSVGREIESLDIDALLDSAVLPDLQLSRPSVPDASLTAETVAYWTERRGQLERAHLSRNIAILRKIQSEGQALTVPEIETRCHADGVDVKRFLAWYGSLPRGPDGDLLDVRRSLQVPRGWRDLSALARVLKSHDPSEDR